MSDTKRILVKRITSGIPTIGVKKINGLDGLISLLDSSDILITIDSAAGTFTFENTSTLDTVTGRGDSTSNSVTFGDITTTGRINGPSTMILDPNGDNAVTGELRVLGDLRVDGTTTSVNSTEVSFNDKNIVLGDDAGLASDLHGAGLTIGNDALFGGPAPLFTYNYTNNRFELNRALFVSDDITADSASITVLTVDSATFNRIKGEIHGSYIDSNSIENDRLVNSTITFTDGVDSQVVDLGETVTFNGGTDLTATVSPTNTITFSHDPSGVTAGTYGSVSQIPVFAVDSQGHVDSVANVSISTTLSLVSDSDSGSVSLLDSSMSINEGEGIDISLSGTKFTVSAEDATITNKGIASFDSGDFEVSSGQVFIKTAGVGNSQLENDTVTIGSTGIALGDSSDTLSGLSQVTTTNLNVTDSATINQATVTTLDVTGTATLASASVTDLTNDRIVIAGASGELEDDANLTYDGSTLTVANSTASTNSANGALVVTGGVGIGGALNVGGNLEILGDFTVSGTTTTVAVQTLSVSDPLIHLADSNETADEVDIGFVAHYYDVALGGKQHTGLFRDADDDKYYLFAQYQDSALDSSPRSNVIDRSDSSFVLADLNAATIFADTFSGTVSADSITTTNFTATTVDINGGFIDGTAIGHTTPDSGTFTNLARTSPSGVTAGEYGSVTEIPVVTVDASGFIDSIGEVAISTTLNTLAETGTGSVNLLDSSLEIAAGEGINTTASGNTVTIAGEDASTSNKGVASFDASDFVVTSGAVSLATDITIDSNLQVNTLTVVDSATIGGNLTFVDSDDLILPDNSRIKLGDGGDLQIYHDGNHSRINEAGSGSLYIQATNLVFRSAAGETYAQFLADGATQFFHDANLKLKTLSTGVDVNGEVLADSATIAGDLTVDTNTLYVDATNNRVGIGTTNPQTALDVTGTVTADGFTVDGDITFSDSDDLIMPDNSRIKLGDGPDLQIYHDGTNSRIADTGTGELRLQGTNLRLWSASGENYLTATEHNAVSLYYDNSAKIATTSTGVDVTGEAHADSDFFTDDVPMRARTFAMSMMYGI